MPSVQPSSEKCSRLLTLTDWFFGEDFDENFDPDAPTLTPRQCHVVAQVARELADAVFADAHLLGDRHVQPSSNSVVLAEFPECTWAQDATWRRTMVRAFDDLAADAAAPHFNDLVNPF